MTFFRVLISSVFLGAVALVLLGPAHLANDLMNGSFQTFALAMGAVYYLELLVWFYAVRSIDISLASSITIPAPVVTMILAVVFLGETIAPYQVIGMTFVFIGLAGLIHAGERRRRTALLQPASSD